MLTSRILNTILIAIILLLNAGCEKALDLKNINSNKVSVFEEAWNLLDKHYALFEIKNVDWNNTYKEFRPKVTDGMSDKELFNVISNMFQTLKDGHVTLISPSDTSTYTGFYSMFPGNFNYKNIITNYLNNDYKTSGPLLYKVAGNIGYLYYSSFENNITDDQIDAIISEVSNTKGLIVDVRNNTGGNPANADKLFQRFISGKTLVKYELIKKGSGHEDFFDPRPYYLSPFGTSYKNPVCVLTNRSCFSTCNDFVLYMSQLPNVKIIGDQTGGGGGIPYNYILANGWKIQYTATITLSPGKVNIENGISPDVPVVITPVDETNGKDPILDKAIQLLQ